MFRIDIFRFLCWNLCNCQKQSIFYFPRTKRNLDIKKKTWLRSVLQGSINYSPSAADSFISPSFYFKHSSLRECLWL